MRVGAEEVRQECNGGKKQKCNWEHRNVMSGPLGFNYKK